jgi:long-chain acyl-CoA synthetase
MKAPRTLCELFEDSIRERPRAAAFLLKKDGAYRPVSTEQVRDRVRAVAGGLRLLGVRPGDRVAILSENRIEWALADYAILMCGAIVVPIYATLQPQQVQTQVADSGAVAAFVSNGEQAAKLGDSTVLPALRTVIPFDAESQPAKRDAGGREVVTWAQLETRGAARGDMGAVERAARTVQASDIATIIYTSGTSGQSKGVVLTHGNLCSNIDAVLRRVPMYGTDTCLSFLPLSHVFERCCGHFLMWHVGARIAYAESVDSVADNLVEVRPTVLVSVPRLYEKMNARIHAALAKAPLWRRKLFDWGFAQGRERVRCEQAGESIPRLLAWRCVIADRLVFRTLRARLGGRIRQIFSGGAPLSRPIAEFFHAAGLPILEGYGLTETSPVLTANSPERPRIGTVGPALDNVELRIADNGEILARGPSIMRGYFNNPRATAEAMADGWFHTGDIGEIDSDGSLRITDRLKDLIVTAGGKKVAPQPIEARLKACPFLAEAVLVGDRRKYVSALVVPNFANLEAHARTHGISFASHADLVVTPAVLRLFADFIAGVNAELAQFERIKRFRILDRELQLASGELTPSMKVKRAAVARAFEPLIESMYTDPAPAEVGAPAGVGPD